MEAVVEEAAVEAGEVVVAEAVVVEEAAVEAEAEVEEEEEGRRRRRWGRLNRLVVAEVLSARPGRGRNRDRAPAAGKQAARCGTGASGGAVVRI